MPRTARLILLAALPAALAACAVGPDYVRPSMDVPAAYREAGAWKVAEPGDRQPRGPWWEIFGDAKLNALEEQVAQANFSVQIAQAQFRQARALAQAARAAYFPTLSASVASTRGQASASSGGLASGGTATSNALTLDAGWEPDIWGRVARSVEGAQAGVQAGAADLEGVRLSMQAELAQDYFMLRVADAQKRLLDDTVDAYEKSLLLTRNRYKAGVDSRVDEVQAETQLKLTQAQSVDIGVQRAQLDHAIAVLLGKAPAVFSVAAEPFVAGIPAIPAGVPSQLLERRPDIAGAERRAAAANAQIGVAAAAYFPSLTLSATGGYQSSTLANWFSVPNRFWSLGPSLAETLFDGGLRHAQSEQATAAYDAAVATYRQTVLGRFQEVEDNLAALRILEQEAKIQDEAVKAAVESVVLTTNQYKSGTVSYLNVIAVQTVALSAERTAANILGQRLSAAVLLVKALGGGWDASALPPADVDAGRHPAEERPSLGQSQP